MAGQADKILDDMVEQGWEKMLESASESDQTFLLTIEPFAKIVFRNGFVRGQASVSALFGNETAASELVAAIQADKLNDGHA